MGPYSPLEVLRRAVNAASRPRDPLEIALGALLRARAHPGIALPAPAVGLALVGAAQLLEGLGALGYGPDNDTRVSAIVVGSGPDGRTIDRRPQLPGVAAPTEGASMTRTATGAVRPRSSTVRGSSPG